MTLIMSWRQMSIQASTCKRSPFRFGVVATRKHDGRSDLTSSRPVEIEVLCGGITSRPLLRDFRSSDMIFEIRALQEGRRMRCSHEGSTQDTRLDCLRARYQPTSDYFRGPFEVLSRLFTTASKVIQK